MQPPAEWLADAQRRYGARAISAALDICENALTETLLATRWRPHAELRDVFTDAFSDAQIRGDTKRASIYIAARILDIFDDVAARK